MQSSITFDGESRLGILFEDRNFTNSKKYFWALQSLRIFAEHIDVTLRCISNIFLLARKCDGNSPDREEELRHASEWQGKFEELRDRIERKRQEIQSLSDGVGCQFT